MKIILTTLFLIGSVAQASLMQPTIPPDLIAAAAARQDAVGKNDARAFGALVAEDMLYVAADGRLSGKLERMRAAADQPKEKFDATNPFSKSNSRTRMYGDTAVRHWLTEQGSPTIGSEVWVKLDGSWQLVHVQFTPQTQR